MPHPQNPDVISSNPVPDDVRVDKRPLAEVGTRNWTTALRKVFQAVARANQFSREILRRAPIKPGDVTVGVVDVA
jgi:hypothetical protein